MNRAPLLLGLLCAAAEISCGPQLDSSGSNPGGVASLADLYANDPVLSYDAYNQAIILGYDDQAGAFDADVATQTLTPKAHPSRMGVTISHDGGMSWQRIGPIPAADAACGDPTCPVAIAGSPSIAPFEEGTAAYVALAYTDTSLHQPDAVAYASSDDGGLHWTVPRVAGLFPGPPPGEPTIDRPGSIALLAYTDRDQGQLQLLVGSNDPLAFETPPVTVTFDRDDVGVPKAHPILRAIDGTHAYVAYLLPRDEQGSTFDLRVATIYRERRGLVLLPWHGLVIFRLDNLAIDASRPGGLGRTWRDASPLSFTIADGPRLYVAFRTLSSTTGLSRVYVAACDATWAPNCSVYADGTNSPGWMVDSVDDLVQTDPFHGGEYRPVVAADPNSGAVGVSWMQEVSPGASAVTLGGAFSTSSTGLVLGDAMDLRAGSNGGPWTPCPTAGLVTASTHSYGDHDALLVLPFDPMMQTTPSLIGAHVDSSGGCQALGELTFDQHVAVSTW